MAAPEDFDPSVGDDFTLGDDTPNEWAEQLASVYHGCFVRQTYRYNSGCIQLPVAGEAIDGTTASEIVQLECPWSTRRVFFDGQREGLTPDIPDPLQDIHENEVCLESEITVDSAVPGASGQPYFYHVYGETLYASVYPRMPVGPSNKLTANGDGGLQPTSGDEQNFFMGGKLVPLLRNLSTEMDALPTKRFITGMVEPKNPNLAENDPNVPAEDQNIGTDYEDESENQ